MLTFRRSISILTALLLPIPGVAEQAGESIDLADLSAFQAAAANWSTAGGAWADPGTEHSLEALAGEGVLVNRPTPAARDKLLSRVEHGDAEGRAALTASSKSCVICASPPCVDPTFGGGASAEIR